GSFDLDRVDVLATGLDQVLRPIDEGETPRGVLHEHVAHVEPAATELVCVHRGSTPVAAEEGGAAHRDFPGRAGGYITIVLIHQTPQVEGVVGLGEVRGLLAD